MTRLEMIKRIHMMKSKAKECIQCHHIYYRNSCPKCNHRGWIKLSDDTYRKLLKDTVGVDSCASMNERSMETVINMFEDFGWLEYEKELSKKYQEGRKRIVAIILSEGKRVLGPDYEKRIESFVKKKTGKTRLSSCDDNTLRMVIGWIRRTGKSSKNKSMASAKLDVKEEAND